MRGAGSPPKIASNTPGYSSGSDIFGGTPSGRDPCPDNARVGLDELIYVVLRTRAASSTINSDAGRLIVVCGLGLFVAATGTFPYNKKI